MFPGKRSVGIDFWLSGTDLGHNGVFKWASTGRFMTYQKWAPSRPSKPKSDSTSNNTCVEINQILKNEMSNYNCSSRQYYVCEYWREIERNWTDILYYPEDWLLYLGYKITRIEWVLEVRVVDSYMVFTHARFACLPTWPAASSSYPTITLTSSKTLCIEKGPLVVEKGN